SLVCGSDCAGARPRSSLGAGEGGDQMSSRREFLGAGLCFVGCSMLGAHAHAQGARRTVTVGGKRMKVIDVHAHAAVGEAMELAGLKLGAGNNRVDLGIPET